MRFPRECSACFGFGVRVSLCFCLLLLFVVRTSQHLWQFCWGRAAGSSFEDAKTHTHTANGVKIMSVCVCCCCWYSSLSGWFCVSRSMPACCSNGPKNQNHSLASRVNAARILVGHFGSKQQQQNPLEFTKGSKRNQSSLARSSVRPSVLFAFRKRVSIYMLRFAVSPFLPCLPAPPIDY